MKEWFEKYQYLKPFCASLLLHIILFGFFLLSVENGSSTHASSVLANPGEIVHAVVVDEGQVQAEISHLQQAEIQQKKAVEDKQKALADSLDKVKKERAQEQAKLEQLKRDMAKAKQEEQNRLSEIQIAKEKEQKQLDDLKQAKEKEKNQLDALDDQRQAEQVRVKQMRQEREKEEKKKNEAAKNQLAAKHKADEAKRAAGIAAREGEKLAAERQGFIVNEAQKVADAWGDKIKRNKNQTFGLPSGLKCVLRIRVLPDGNIQVSLLKSSGNSVHDNLSINAAYKSQPLELPEDPAIRERTKEFDIGIESDEG